MIGFREFEAITFDCYGTLIDWETGILNALRPIMRAHGVSATEGDLLKAYAEHEAIEEAGEFKSYRDVLGGVVAGVGMRYGFDPSMDERDALVDSIDGWPVFSDTVEALRVLSWRYRLGIISNVDDDIFAATAQAFEVDFDMVLTSEQARSYKPSSTSFALALTRLGLPKDKMLHVAESVRHDIVPAKAMEISCVWVNRVKASGRAAGASGATSETSSGADIEVPDLRTLVKTMGLSG